MFKAPIQFIEGREGIGYVCWSTQWALLRVTDQDGVVVPDEPSYSYQVMGEAQVVSDPSDEQESPPPLAPTYGTVITKSALRNRFTQAEKAGVEFAAVDMPTATLEQRQVSAALRAMLRDMDLVETIDLAHPLVQQGIQWLESIGLLDAGRANEVLTAPVQEHEVPK